jgi:catechol 2,3-dioxygenase-like lactoylglutathione lyase family enzyme
MVLVQDMDRAVRFYRDVLGLSLGYEEEDWAAFDEGVGLLRAEEPLDEDGLRLNSVSLSLHVSDVNAAYAELIGSGIPFVVPPTDVAGTVVASFRDTEGNVLQLVQASP